MTPEQEHFFLVELEEQFEIHVPDERFVEARTIAQLTNLLNTLMIDRESVQKDYENQLCEAQPSQYAQRRKRIFDHSKEATGRK